MWWQATKCTSHLPSRQSTSWRWRAHGCGSPFVQWSDWDRWYCWRRGPQTQQRGRSHWSGTQPGSARSASGDLAQEHNIIVVSSREDSVFASSQTYPLLVSGLKTTNWLLIPTDHLIIPVFLSNSYEKIHIKIDLHLQVTYGKSNYLEAKNLLHPVQKQFKSSQIRTALHHT